MTWLLAIETALCGAAIGMQRVPSSAQGVGEPWIKVVDHFQDSARFLPSILDEGRRALGLDFEDCGGIVLSMGPGSFTGLRVGFSYAQGLAAGISVVRKEPVKWLGLSSLSLLARDLYLKSHQERAVTVALAATKTSGFRATMSPEDTKDVFMDVLDTSSLPKGLESHRVVVIHAWEALQVTLNCDVESLEVRAAAQRSLELLLSEGEQRWPLGFEHSCPDPSYMKRSSVEEKNEVKA